MHSRIFGTVEKDYYNDLVSKGEIPCIDYEEVPHFADYTDNDTNLDEDFDWLLECIIHQTDSGLVSVNHDEHTIMFKKGFKERYFRGKWDTLIKNLVGDPEAYNKFCTNDMFAYGCRKLLDEEYGFYVADEYGGYETLDNFIRRVDYDKEYKVFQSIDYHY